MTDGAAPAVPSHQLLSNVCSPLLICVMLSDTDRLNDKGSKGWTERNQASDKVRKDQVTDGGGGGL